MFKHARSTVRGIVLAAMLSPLHGSTFTVLANLPNYQSPMGPPVILNGALYGTARPGRTDYYSVLYKGAPPSTISDLYFFPQTGPAGALTKDLIAGHDGNLYGVAVGGGANGAGAFFGFSPSGVLLTTTPFATYSPSGVVQASDGTFYGTADYQTPSFSYKAIAYRISTTGTLSTLAYFPPKVGIGLGAPVQGLDGNLYGTTSGNENYNSGGNVYRITPAGVYSTLVTLPSLELEDYPYYGLSGLTLGDDGNFYGTASQGGPQQYGSVFKVTPKGLMTTLATFDYTTNGGGPAGLVKSTDGNFYGSTTEGGANQFGTIYKVTPKGTLTTLVDFDYGTGISQLVVGPEGIIYGTSQFGVAPAGVADYVPGGAVFSLNPFNAITYTLSPSWKPTIDALEFSISSASTIALKLPFAPTTGTVYTLVRMEGGRAIQGVFNNLPPGATITATYNGHTYSFKATYKGGATGNDLTLTAL